MGRAGGGSLRHGGEEAASIESGESMSLWIIPILMNVSELLVRLCVFNTILSRVFVIQCLSYW